AEPRRQLHEQRAQPVVERRDAREERGDLGVAIAEQLVVADRAWELEAEPKARRHLRLPARHGIDRGEGVERRVALDRVEHLRVAREEVCGLRAALEQSPDPARQAPAEVVATDHATST